MKKTYIRVCALLLVLSTILGGALISAPKASAAGVPSSMNTVWDMEALPDDLYAADIAWDMTGTYGGHNLGYVDASRAEGKGYQGSAAAAITFTAGANPSWENGVYLRLSEDDSANADWYNATQFWFWVDVSEFKNTDIYMDLAIDGVFPQLNKPYYIVENGNLVEKQTLATWNGAVFGRLGLPRGYKGWVGIDLSAFKATFGKVQSVGFGIAPQGDSKKFPLSMYIDQFSVVRGSKEYGALEGTGELFNKDVPLSENKLYTNLTKTYQTVESYGASGAWWTSGWGTADFVDPLLEMVFTDAGAGLNNYRHNIGASVKADKTDASSAMLPSRAPLSPLTEDGKYDEDRDIGGYTVLMKLQEMGTIDDFTLFINSPPSTMTNSGMTFGDIWAESPSNLRSDCYEAFASYVVDMVQLYNWCGVPIKYVSPINEPHYSWDSGSQEGCHYTAAEAVEILTLVIKELQERSIQDPTIAHVKVSFAESGTWSNKSFVNYIYLQLYTKPELQDKIAHICAHSYGTSQSDKERLAREMRNIGAQVQFRQTEYGPAYAQPDLSITSGLDVARVMYEDLSILNVDGWSYWLTAANGLYTDGLVYFNIGSEDLMPSKRLWAMGQYARFTKGAIRIDVDEYGLPKGVKATGYVNPEDGTLVYVVLNEGTADQTFSFVGLPAGSVAQVYETSAIRDLELRGTITADAGYVLPAESITTFVFSNIKFEDVASASNPNNTMGSSVNAAFDYSIFYAKNEEPDQEPTQDPTEATQPEQETTTQPNEDATQPTQSGNDATQTTKPDSDTTPPTQSGNDATQPATKPEEASKPGQTEEPSADPSGIVIVIVAIVILAGAGAVAFIFIRRKKAQQPSDDAAPAETAEAAEEVEETAEAEDASAEVDNE